MDSKGYCTPHKCPICEDLYLDFSLKEPWEILKPLHKSMQTWSADRQNEAPGWILPLSMRKLPTGTEKATLLSKVKNSIHRIRQTGSRISLNTQYREALLQDDTLRAEAANSLEKTRFFNITFRECAHRAQRGCDFFSKLIKGELDRTPQRKLKPGDGSCILGACESYDGLEFGVPRFGSQFRGGMEIDPVHSFEMLTDAENPAAEAIPNLAVEMEPGSATNLSILNAFFQNCQNLHPDCKTRKAAFTPTRLLELYYEHEKRMLRVVCVPLETHPKYAAVSYCWGTKQYLNTTQGNLSRLTNGISHEELPATLRDVVLVAEALELRFLWIDSLCIIQDDVHSKAAEMRTMSDIYENAAVTIVASRAKDVYEGILKRREPVGSQFPDSVFEMRYNKDLTRPGSVVLVKYWHSRDPLDHRAWALQERLVSPCIIDLASNQTRWICRTLLSGNFVDGGRTSGLVSSERRYLLYRKLHHYWKGFSDRKPIEVWHNVVEDYSLRHITNLSDRLPAIAAIAQQFSEVLGQDYLAGLWSSNLPYELLWKLWGTNTRKKPQEYLGPSWSWVSIMDSVRYDDGYETPQGYKSLLLPKDEHFEIIEHDVQLRWNEFKFGEVTSARLVVRGIRRKVLWIPGDQYKMSSQYCTLITEDRSFVLPVRFTVDFLVDDHDTINRNLSIAVELLLIAAQPDKENSRSNMKTEITSAIVARERKPSIEAKKTFTSEVNKGESSSFENIRPASQPYLQLKGLVLRQLSCGNYGRLGVFEFIHFYSSEFADYDPTNSAKLWSKSFKEYLRQTNWMMEGEVKTFSLI